MPNNKEMNTKLKYLPEVRSKGMFEGFRKRNKKLVD